MMRFIFAGIALLLFLACNGETKFQPPPQGIDMKHPANEPLKNEIMEPMAMERKCINICMN